MGLINLTCELLDQLFALSFSKSIVCYPNQAVKSPSHASLLFLCIWNWIKESIKNCPSRLKESHHETEISYPNSLFRIEILDSQVFIPDKYVVIWGHYVRMQKSFGIPPLYKISEGKDYKHNLKKPPKPTGQKQNENLSHK